MDTERSGLDEAMDVGSSTVSHLKSLKTAATFSKAGYGAALGGPFTAAIGAVIANRNQLAVSAGISSPMKYRFPLRVHGLFATSFIRHLLKLQLYKILQDRQMSSSYLSP